jgi:hypothetical protein
MLREAVPDVSPQRILRPFRKGRRGAIARERGVSAFELGLSAQYALHGAFGKVAQAIGTRRARIHDRRLDHEQARETCRQQLRGQQQVGRAGAVADAIDIGEIECLDDPADILRKIKEMIVVSCGLVAVAMAAAVERIDRVVLRKFAGDVVPDLGDEAGAVQQQRGRFAGILRAPSRQRNARVGIADRNPNRIRQARASSKIIVAPFSAIIAVGVLVLPDVIVGITEASATRKPLMP